jgi:hypothetical protein
MLRGYSSPLALGHKGLENLWKGTVYVQEKADGSQISFGLDETGTLSVKSRTHDITLDVSGMWKPALEFLDTIKDKLHPGWIYRGEYLKSPHHNALVYGRIPTNYIMLYDIDKGDQDYLMLVELAEESNRIGLECVPLLAVYTEEPDVKELMAFLERDSILGGVKIEGIVCKNYALYGADHKVIMGKLVSKDFQEKNSSKQRSEGKDFIELLSAKYATEARWRKAVQHLRESGTIQGIPQDIPLVMNEIDDDLEKECGEEIKETVFKHFFPSMKKMIKRGMPEWYREVLLQEQFQSQDNTQVDLTTDGKVDVEIRFDKKY